MPNLEALSTVIASVAWQSHGRSQGVSEQHGLTRDRSLRAIARELGIVRDTVRKYDYAEPPPSKDLSAEERAKLWGYASPDPLPNNRSDMFAFHLSAKIAGR